MHMVTRVKEVRVGEYAKAPPFQYRGGCADEEEFGIRVLVLGA